MHLAASHFVAALGVPGVRWAHKQVHDAACAKDFQGEDEDEDTDQFDVDVSMEIEPLPDDVEAIKATLITDFDAGDVVGKLLAFISQLCLCSEDTCNYLKYIGALNRCPEWEIKLWVHTRWGSLSDCFHTALDIRKVCY